MRQSVSLLPRSRTQNETDGKSLQHNIVFSQAVMRHFSIAKQDSLWNRLRHSSGIESLLLRLCSEPCTYLRARKKTISHVHNKRMLKKTLLYVQNKRMLKKTLSHVQNKRLLMKTLSHVQNKRMCTRKVPHAHAHKENWPPQTYRKIGRIHTRTRIHKP